MKPALLVMAAGLGSRYGGLKQIDPVGPGGETLLDYAVFDAQRAGFGRVVFVIRREIEAAFRTAIGRRYERRLDVAYAFQELADVPAGFAPRLKRSKPWGTGHAVLSAAAILHEPFAAANADDFYGADSFRALAAFLGGEPPRAGPELYAVVGFVLSRTLSEHGPVARGLCETTKDGLLARVEEVLGLERDDGAVRDAAGRHFSGDALVSLNLWGFRTSLFAQLGELFAAFLNDRGRDAKAEFYLPDAVDRLIQDGRARVRVLPTPSPWFGITHRADLPIVRERLLELVRKGDYPERLFAE